MKKSVLAIAIMALVLGGCKSQNKGGEAAPADEIAGEKNFLPI